jgi:integrating conjugative element protein (TIGR03752 family)
VVPLGYRTAPGGDASGGAPLVRTSLGGGEQNLLALPGATGGASAGAAANSSQDKPKPVPYFTIPENATLGRSTAMTTLVGRVPIDGRVQDPMQFKLVVGRDNLAASGQYVPDDISGIVISGVAVGDMALSCTEGLIQSMTFVFDDGTIRTVSQRTGGASVGFGSSGGGGGGGGGLGGGGAIGGQSLATAPKLGWISDEFGNPCIPGQFVTNAPAYLADVMGLKALSSVGAAIAATQTTTTSGASALGSTTSSTVTGDAGKYVLGSLANSSANEVVSWLTKRMNNSFDAVVVRAGTRVAVHIDRPIAIDKDPEGRRLDYGRARTSLAEQQGAHHGLD